LLAGCAVHVKVTKDPSNTCEKVLIKIDSVGEGGNQQLKTGKGKTKIDKERSLQLQLQKGQIDL
jgi:hypothetical protein